MPRIRGRTNHSPVRIHLIAERMVLDRVSRAEQVRHTAASRTCGVLNIQCTRTTRTYQLAGGRECRSDGRQQD